MRTNLHRVFAAGDITEYPGKVRLIAVGFGEAATAVNNAAVAIDPSAHVFPGHSSEGRPEWRARDAVTHERRRGRRVPARAPGRCRSPASARTGPAPDHAVLRRRRRGRIAFWTYGRSQKIRNLERDPRISLLVEDGEDYFELRGVSISGTAEMRA